MLLQSGVREPEAASYNAHDEWGHIHTCTCIKSSPTRGRRWSACPYRNAVLTPLRNGCGCRCWSRREVPLVQVPANGHSFQFFLRVLPPALLDRKPDRLAICVALNQHTYQGMHGQETGEMEDAEWMGHHRATGVIERDRCEKASLCSVAWRF